MRAREIVGKTVESVKLITFYNENLRSNDSALESITFTDGTVLILVAHETDQEPFTAGLVRRPVSPRHATIPPGGTL